jgi:hypothetical protein
MNPGSNQESQQTPVRFFIDAVLRIYGGDDRHNDACDWTFAHLSLTLAFMI